MGIITEGARPSITSASAAATQNLVRPRAASEGAHNLVAGKHSIALRKSCVVYRNVFGGSRVMTVVPLCSIASFSIRTCRRKALFSAGFLLLLASAGVSLWELGLPLFRTMLLRLSQTDFAPNLVYVSVALFLGGSSLLLAYLFLRRTDLVFCTASGGEGILLHLPGKMAGAAESLVEEIESRIERLACGDRDGTDSSVPQSDLQPSSRQTVP